MRFSATSIALLVSSTLCVSSAQVQTTSGTVKPDKAARIAKAAGGSGGATRGAGITTSLATGSQYVVGPEDDCSAPLVIAAQGNFAYDGTNATTGTQGQTCTAMNNDLWFEWTADATGFATVSNCNNTSVDSKLASYAGAGCPAGTCLDSNDDACGLQSTISFAVTNGNVYMLQVGTWSTSSTAGGPGSLDISIFVPPAVSDDCAAPLVIAGQGNFGYNGTGATTGTQGQTCTTVNNDVWLEWTADATGTARVGTCFNTTVDTKLAGYDGAGCPTATALACNDDSCGLQSEIAFACVLGNVYMLQVGTFTAASGANGPGSIDITIAPPASGSDSCTTPDLIAGQGNFAYDLTSTTTGAQGQTCATINNDMWFEWTADMDGDATVSTCNNTSVDTRLASYDGAGCPAGSCLDENDDTCGLQSEITFSVLTGNVYMVQVGTWSSSSTAGGPGSIDIVINIPPPPPACYTLDFGVSDNAVGFGAASDTVIVQAYTAPLGSDTITEISATFGTPMFPGNYSGGNLIWALWDDPTNDNDPSDAVLLWTGADVANGANIETDVFQVAAVPSIPVTGTFFVGVAISQAAGQFPGSLEQDTGSNGRAWIANNSSGTLDLANLLNNDFPVAEMAGLGIDGVWMLRAVGPNCDPGGVPGNSFCAGDSTGGACPCSAFGGPGEGCANSSGLGGAIMVASGTASIANDSFVLDITGVPGNKFGLVIQAANQLGGGNGIMAGDGLICIAGSSLRSQVQLTSNGATTFTDFQGSPFGTMGLGAGVPTNYQFWYRDPGNTCTGSQFNFTNAWTVTWLP